jgi:protein tyrosine/serine phosphatase
MLNLVNFRPVAESIWKNFDIKLFRTSTLLNDKDTAKSRYNSLVVDCHIDLRTKEECKNFPITGTLLRKANHYKNYSLRDFGLAFKECHKPTSVDYCKYYIDLIDNNSRMISVIFKEISTSNDRSYIISCHAGKDRTGIICSLLLSLLGISRNIIFQDYIKSGEYLFSASYVFEVHWRKRNISENEYIIRLMPKEETLKLFFEYLDETYGGPICYLNKIGLDKSDIIKIQRKFHESIDIDFMDITNETNRLRFSNYDQPC